MDNIILAVAALFAFATLNESLMEYLFGNVERLHSYLPLIGLAGAILLTFTYQINLFSVLLELESNSPFLDFLLSAFIIARVSNFINDFAQKLLGSK